MSNEFTQPDYDVIYKDPDGRELTVGRIFRNHGLVGGERPWFWGVQFFQRQGRAKPDQGQVDTVEEAKAAWRKCWDSADTPINWPPSKRLGEVLADVPRGRVVGAPADGVPTTEAGHYAKCPACGGWFDQRDLGQALAHDGPLPHDSRDKPQ